MRLQHFSLMLVLPLVVSACKVGPNYIRPAVNTPTHFKEADPGWKIAASQDAFIQSAWWEIYQDPQLNTLESQLNNANQNIAIAAANYQQASAVVDEARALYYPSLATTVGAIRQKQSNSTPTGITNNYALLLNASWEPDLWGKVRRTVEASKAASQASKNLLAAVRLSEQATLAQIYFELRTTDTNQALLEQALKDSQNLLILTEHRNLSGVDSLVDVVQARSQVESAQAAVLNNKIIRAQFEHGIAVLIGQPPSQFTLPALPFPITATPPQVPLLLPCTLLERRPDIAQSERLVTQANAEIGIAISAFFPNLSIASTSTYQSQIFDQLIKPTTLSWAVGAQLAETLFDGGLRSAVTRGARANYEGTVAAYRQTVLSAFQDVEDNLAALKFLNQQTEVQTKAAQDAKLALELITHQYQAGTTDYLDVLTAQLNAYAAERTAANVRGLWMISSVTLIKALGGGWHATTNN